MAETPQNIDEFDDIRPYPDHEIPERVARLCEDPDLIASVAQLFYPRTSRVLPSLLQFLTKRSLLKKTKNISSRASLNLILSDFVAQIVENSTDGFSYSGLEALSRDRANLYISNHRDITLDSIFVNYALWLNDYPTTQVAVGDNLFNEAFETELMRLNRSFVVVRSAKGVRAHYAAMSRTSRYIRFALEAGESIWIAQREGRSKDGRDHTDPAVLKMFLLAYRDELRDFDEWLSRVSVVPVSLSYELDPCATRKARELLQRDTTGNYVKSPTEDRESMILGITGFKGRVHVAFAPPVEGTFESADALATEIDNRLAQTRQIYPTYTEGANLLEDRAASVLQAGRVKDHFEQALAEVSVEERPYLLQQYAYQRTTDVS